MTYLTKAERPFFIVRAALIERMHSDHLKASRLEPALCAAYDDLRAGKSRAHAVRVGYAELRK